LKLIIFFGIIGIEKATFAFLQYLRCQAGIFAFYKELTSFRTLLTQ